MYLVDTNIWLELLLDQEKAEDVRNLLRGINPSVLYMTHFTLYSIGIILLKLGKPEVLLSFVRDTLLDGVKLISLDPGDMEVLVKVAEQFNLDFDDAYQYVAAEKYNLEIVSFDTDFDRTERGRKTPAQIMKN